MKKAIFTIFFLLLTIPAVAQWQLTWTSAAFPAAKKTGWIYFDKVGTGWQSRLYAMDSTKFTIMEAGLSSTPAYNYFFNSNEILAGYAIYSMKYDLNGDNKTDFYTLSHYGYGYPRQGFRIFDITTGATIFEKNEQGWYYYDPILFDVDNDGMMECIVIKFDFPYFYNHYYEVYRTNLLTTSDYQLPAKFELLQNYPNPFNPSTSISFSLNKQDNVEISIYDVKGELVSTLLNETKNPGFHEVEWNGLNSHGKRQSSGVYFYEIKTGSERAVKKMMMLK